MNGENLLDLDEMEQRFQTVVRGRAWKEVEQAVAAADLLLIFGNGGNLAVAQHAAADLVRLTDKRAIAPGGSVAVTSVANEFGFADWLAAWLLDELRGRSAGTGAGAVALGLSCSGASPSVIGALRAAGEEVGVVPVLLTASTPRQRPPGLVVELGARYYHSAETLMSLLMYQLAVASGAVPRRLD